MNPSNAITPSASASGAFSVDQLKAQLANVQQRFHALPSKGKLWIAGAGICTIAIAAFLCWLAAKPSWKVLYAGLDPQDARELSAELTAANLPYDVSPDGTTLKVPADVLDKARLQTAGKGGSKSGRLGFELFDKPNWAGSEFDEKVNYQRALEGELEHTISTLDSVQAAHVHLVLPHDSLFTEQQRKAKASVVLKLKHRALSANEAESIRNLVSNAVDDLSPADVALIDADGRTAFGPKSADATEADHEQMLADRLIATIEPIAGVGNVRASVNVEYDPASSDELDETYDPNNTVTLSMQRSEQQAGERTPAAGVPGTQSNAPNVQPPLFPTKAAEEQSLKQESGTYAASKKVRHTLRGPGSIKRVTAAVLLNDRAVTEHAGKKSERHEVAWSPDEVKHITELAQAAVGFDASRGDMVSVKNISFADASVGQPTIAQKLLSEISGTDILRYAFAIAAAGALLLFVSRPAVRSLKTLGSPNSPPAAPAFSALDEPVADENNLLSVPRSQRQLWIQQLSELVEQDASQSARLVQSWMESN